MTRDDGSLPVFDVRDYARVGFEIGINDAGDLLIRTGQCGTHQIIRIQRGGQIGLKEDGSIIFQRVTMLGSMDRPFEGHAPECNGT